MAKITLRPTSGSGSNWSNITSAYDGNESTNASVSVSLFSSPRTLTLNFDTSVIPSGATINSATLTMRSKAGKTTITANTDIHAQYTIKTYIVRFLDWNNTVLDTQTINHGSNATPPSNPVREGYTFIGWQGSYTNITANTDIIATYEKNTVHNIKIGNNTINSIYIGDNKIIKVYLGDTLLFE